MFRMEIESQLNMADRTLIGGIAGFTRLPEFVNIRGKQYHVIGVSGGVKLPYLSLEIEKTSDQLKGNLAVA